MFTLSGTGLLFGILFILAMGIAIGFAAASIRTRLQIGGSAPLELKKDFDEYRGKVDQHFVTTNDLLRKMSEQYREVYLHMAEGARDLSSSDAAKIQDHLLLTRQEDEAGTLLTVDGDEPIAMAAGDPDETSPDDVESAGSTSAEGGDEPRDDTVAAREDEDKPATGAGPEAPVTDAGTVDETVAEAQDETPAPDAEGDTEEGTIIAAVGNEARPADDASEEEPPRDGEKRLDAA